MKAAAVVLNYNLPELTDRLCSDGIFHRQTNPYNYDQACGVLHTNDWDVKRRFMQEMYGEKFSESQIPLARIAGVCCPTDAHHISPDSIST